MSHHRSIPYPMRSLPEMRIGEHQSVQYQMSHHGIANPMKSHPVERIEEHQSGQHQMSHNSIPYPLKSLPIKSHASGGGVPSQKSNTKPSASSQMMTVVDNDPSHTSKPQAKSSAPSPMAHADGKAPAPSASSSAPPVSKKSHADGKASAPSASSSAPPVRKKSSGNPPKNSIHCDCQWHNECRKLQTAIFRHNSTNKFF
jgi:hypothetical protein